MQSLVIEGRLCCLIGKHVNSESSIFKHCNDGKSFNGLYINLSLRPDLRFKVVSAGTEPTAQRFGHCSRFKVVSLGKQQTGLTIGLEKAEPMEIRLGQSNMSNSRSDGRVGSSRRPEHTLTISTKRDGRVAISVRAGQYPISILRREGDSGSLGNLSHHLRFKVIKDWNGPNGREIIFRQNDIESVFRHGKPPASVPGHSDHSVIYFIHCTLVREVMMFLVIVLISKFSDTQTQACFSKDCLTLGLLYTSCASVVLPTPPMPTIGMTET